MGQDIRRVHLEVTPGTGLPAYRQVMDQIKQAAARGALREGDQLPSIRELARTLRLNPTTIVKAYTELEHEGAIEMAQGKGAFLRAAGRRFSDRERETLLREHARRFAAEAFQLGAGEELALRLMREELGRTAREEQHG